MRIPARPWCRSVARAPRARAARHGGHDVVQELDDGDLRAQALPDRAHLQADVAAADHDQLLGHRLQRDRAR